MKKLVSIGMLLASSVVAAGQQVQVTGSGSTLDEARTDAVERALMKACKSAIVSDKVFRNRQTERSKVVIYNGCLVKNYTIVDEGVDQHLYKITIKAEVIQNNLPDRILSKSSDWFFYDFGHHQSRTTQLRMRQAAAKNIIDEIFLDFPYSAFNLERSEPYITYNGYQGIMNIDFNITWNKNFVRALEDTFDILQDSKTSAFRASKQNIRINRPYVSRYFGFTNHFITEHVHQSLSNNRPQIRIRIQDGYGKDIINVCYQLRRFTNLYDLTTLYWININSVGMDGDRISIPIPENLPSNAEVTMDVVTMAFCKDFVY